MTNPLLSDMSDDADTGEVRDHPAAAALREIEPAAAVWPARHFSVDPASSPVLMAAFAWAATPAR